MKLIRNGRLRDDAEPNTKRLPMILLAVVALLVVIGAAMPTPQPTEADIAQAKRDADAKRENAARILTMQKAAEVELARKTAKESADTARMHEHARVAGALKRSMKNPASFKLEQALLMKGGALCFRYHATNSFGGIVPGHAVAIGNSLDTTELGWGTHCSGKTGENVTYIRQVLFLYD